MSTVSSVVIVGASLAGAAAAETLRAEGFDGHLILLGEEVDLPYERPPLSKGYLAGATPREQVYLHPESFYADQEIDLRLGVRVVQLDRGAGQVLLDSGQRMRFDRLLLATGAAPRRLPLTGGDLDGVLYLRDLADADALRERFERAGRVVVVGAGWIGSEVAATARQHGLDVTVVDPAPAPLARVLGPDLGEVYRRLHARHGVHLLLGTGLDRLEGVGSVQHVLTSDGQRLPADVVVVGIGVSPRVELAEGAGLHVEDGIVVDDLLTSSDPRIFAAGDVARARHPFYGEHLRVEHWGTARDHGAAVARSMLGRGKPYDALPYFFSDQYDTGMEYRGRASAQGRVVLRGDPDSGQFLAFWLDDNHVSAGMNLDVWDVGDDIERLIRSQAEVDPHRLADPAVPLTEVAAQAGAVLRGPAGEDLASQ